MTDAGPHDAGPHAGLAISGLLRAAQTRLAESAGERPDCDCPWCSGIRIVQSVDVDTVGAAMTTWLSNLGSAMGDLSKSDGGDSDPEAASSAADNSAGEGDIGAERATEALPESQLGGAKDGDTTAKGARVRPVDFLE